MLYPWAMIGPIFVRDDCSQCSGTGTVGWSDDYGWHSGECYDCVGTGRIVRLATLNDSPWVADVSGEPSV